MPAVDEALQETDSRALRPAQRYLLTVPQFADAHPAFPISSLRWLLYQRKGNGLHKAVVRVGRRVLIDEARFFQWIAEQNGEG